MKVTLPLLVLFVLALLLAPLTQAQTSRVIPFNNVTTTMAPSTPGQALTIQLYDVTTGGSAIYCENQTLDVDAGGTITFTFGTGAAPAPTCPSGPPGLKPQDFTSGDSRFLDVVDATATSVLPNPPGRIPLTAVAFALSAPNEVSGNLTLVNSSATAGNIMKEGVLFLHNFGNSNTFLGSSAGNLTMTGSFNTANGTNALGNNTSGTDNTAVGNGALRNNTSGNFNTANGATALFNNTTGKNNTASGFSALLVNSTGDNNTANGSSALANNTTGGDNTATGFTALLSNRTGHSNTAAGNGALRNNIDGDSNTANGFDALTSNISGISNTASGNNALANNTTGSYNTASGNNALARNDTGGDNTASGQSALVTNTAGRNNTAVGAFADVASGGLTNATAIGYGATVNDNNKIRLGNTNVTVIEGQVAFTWPSDVTKKENFEPVDGDEVLQKVRGFVPTSWNYIGHDPKQFRHYGPMAQEFFAAFGHDAQGTIGSSTTINAGDIIGILMIGVQALEKRTGNLLETVEKRTRELRQENDRLKDAVEAFKIENAELKARLEAIERRLGGNATK